MFRNHPQYWKVPFLIAETWPQCARMKEGFLYVSCAFFFFHLGQVRTQTTSSFLFLFPLFLLQQLTAPLLQVTAMTAGKPGRRGSPISTLLFQRLKENIRRIMEDKCGDEDKEQEWDEKC